MHFLNTLPTSYLQYLQYNSELLLLLSLLLYSRSFLIGTQVVCFKKYVIYKCGNWDSCKCPGVVLDSEVS